MGELAIMVYFAAGPLAAVAVTLDLWYRARKRRSR